MDCPNSVQIGRHQLGKQNAGNCKICTDTYHAWLKSDSYTQWCVNGGHESYYERIEAFYRTPSEQEIEECLTVLTEWVNPQPQECCRHECVENRAEIARHHKDFARISQILDTIPNLGGSQRTIMMNKALSNIRNIVG